MAKGEFNRRCQELLKIVGDKNLEGKVVVNQIYAQNQHETLYFRHPSGGGPKFLTRALFQNHQSIMRGLARDALRRYGLNSAMIVGMEKVSRGVYQNAPHEFNDLRNSAAPSVKDRGRFIYNRPPVVKRLTKAQLRAKDRARGRQ